MTLPKCFWPCHYYCVNPTTEFLDALGNSGFIWSTSRPYSRFPRYVHRLSLFCTECDRLENGTQLLPKPHSHLQPQSFLFSTLTHRAGFFHSRCICTSRCQSTPVFNKVTSYLKCSFASVVFSSNHPSLNFPNLSVMPSSMQRPGSIPSAKT